MKYLEHSRVAFAYYDTETQEGAVVLNNQRISFSEGEALHVWLRERAGQELDIIVTQGCGLAILGIPYLELSPRVTITQLTTISSLAKPTAKVLAIKEYYGKFGIRQA